MLYSEPCQTYEMRRFANIVTSWKLLTFCGTLHLRYLTELWIHLWRRPKAFRSLARKRNPVISRGLSILSDSKVMSLSVTGEPLILKFHVLKWTVIKFKCFSYSFPNVQIAVFCFHNKMKRYLFFNSPKTTLNTFNDHNTGLPV